MKKSKFIALLFMVVGAIFGATVFSSKILIPFYFFSDKRVIFELILRIGGAAFGVIGFFILYGFLYWIFLNSRT